MMNPSLTNLLRGMFYFAIAASTALATQAEELPKGLAGDWSLNLDSGLPAWMRVVEEDGEPLVYLRLYVGPAGPHKAKQVDGRLQFEIKKSNKKTNTLTSVTQVNVGLKDGKLDGTLVKTLNGAKEERDRFTGAKVPPMPDSAPDLSKVQFGHPISLFNGKDMTGWRTYESDKTNGWSVTEGMLVNTTTKTDFSPTGSYANLRTEAEFEDFWLHIEFLVEEARNSGIYLRGMYEAQVVDRDSRMQGIQGVGAIFGAIAPSENAGNPGGQWQTYDLTLVDRHVTVVLNGVKVIDNQPIDAPTPGAIYTNAAKPGPIYLQGDHTTVRYRDIYLAPVINK
jgi:hypothetical protein